MNFFEYQTAARKSTGRLVLLFAIAVTLIVASIYFAVMIAFHQDGWWRADVFFCVTGGTLLIILAGSAYKVSQLSSGGKTVAEMLGGRLITPGTADPVERKLLNVVEEMSIASGTPVPPVYIMDDEDGINAFAAGFTPRDAVISVTRGTATMLSRDELQGVVGHEFSHIHNGDMRLNIRLMGILHGILVISMLGYLAMRIIGSGSPRRSSSRGKGDGGGAIVAIFLLGLALYIIGWIGVFFGRIIQAAISRQREFLADASSVQFTRNPGGLSGALKKIGGFVAGSQIEHAAAVQASHFFFANALTSSWFSPYATHPPLPVRIRRIEPRWDGAFPKVEPPPQEEMSEVERKASMMRKITRMAGAPPEEEDDETRQLRLGMATIAMAAVAQGPRPPAAAEGEASGPDRRYFMEARNILDRVGTAGPEHLKYAERLNAEIPQPLSQAAHDTFGACAVVYALLLNDEAAPRAAQIDWLRTNAPPAVFDETQRLIPSVAALRREARLPLIDIAMPALKQLSPAQYPVFRENVRRLVAADNKIDVFEYVLQRTILRRLEPQFDKSVGRQPIEFYALKPLAQACEDTLSALAAAGTDDPKEAARAATMAAVRIGMSIDYRPNTSLDAVDRALGQLAKASPAVKRRVIEACIVCVAADGKATIEEVELLRAVSDALDCPMPPFLPGEVIQEVKNN
jgi:Zn-dependent protease with chaperone function